MEKPTPPPTKKLTEEQREQMISYCGRIVADKWAENAIKQGTHEQIENQLNILYVAAQHFIVMHAFSSEKETGRNGDFDIDEVADAMKEGLGQMRADFKAGKLGYHEFKEDEQAPN